MCGIGVVIGEPGSEILSIMDANNVLQCRGPDHQSTISRNSVVAMATVLHMRGAEMCPQPVDVANGAAKLCWNGEIYQYMMPSIQAEEFPQLQVPSRQSDTQIVAQLLTEALRGSSHTPSSELESVASALSSIYNGEFAFCILTDNALYYGRDCLGRRSLVTSLEQATWKLASVATTTKHDWEEVAPGQVFQYCLTGGERGKIRSVPLQIMSMPCTIAPPPQASPPPNVSGSMWSASFHFEQLLFQAVQRRMESCTHPTEPIGVMFSGGLDSVVLAGMAANLLRHGQVLELYNVAFGSSGTTAAADRIAGLQCYQELKSAHAEKDIRLVLVDVPEWQSVVQEEDRVQQLIFPKASVMDLNIGTALWFASRGIGTVQGEEYRSRAKILILGMGADEQLGGYGRHRKASREGTLRNELNLDIDRIWERNLGRDDRVLSDHGKEARFPFLDPHVMQFLASTPVENICDFSLGPGQGDKRILRLVSERMGLTTASGLVKRAIQFGSRIAHLSDKQRFGSRRQAKGTASFRGAKNVNLSQIPSK